MLPGATDSLCGGVTSVPAVPLWLEEQHALQGAQLQVRVVTLSCCLFKSNYVVICSYSRTQVKWSGFGFFPHGSQWRLMLLQSRRSWGAGASQPQPQPQPWPVPRSRDTFVTDQLLEDPGATYVSFAHIFLGVLLESILNCKKN